MGYYICVECGLHFGHHEDYYGDIHYDWCSKPECQAEYKKYEDYAFGKPKLKVYTSSYRYDGANRL
jgi:hypothetical protein